MSADRVIVVGRLSEFDEGVPRVVTETRRPVAVVLWRGEVYAFGSVCPHRQGPLSAGRVQSPITGHSVGSVEVRPECAIIVCPWHRWEYDLTTGQGIRRPEYKVRTYPAWIEEGMVVVDPSSKRRAVDGERQ